MAQSTLIIGAGNMGGALLSGWLASNILSARNIAILDPSPGVEAVYAIERGARHLTQAEQIAKGVDTVLLAIKPQMYGDMARQLQGQFGVGTLIISIMAGVSSTTLQSDFPNATIVRAMPNTPVSVGKGVTAFFANDTIDAAKLSTVRGLLSVNGSIVQLQSDAQINAVTAISGSGPAYVFYLCEALGAAARSLGLPDDVADLLARETIIGASALMDASDRSPKALREAVTSPGGTTQAALSVLMQPDGLSTILTDAVRAAFDRAEALSD